VAWAAATLVGAVLMALPDNNDRVLTFTEDHGPALVDTVGMLLVVAGFAAYVAALVLARRRVRRADALVALVGYLGGTALTAWSVSTDTGWWWALGLAVAYAGMGWLAWRLERPARTLEAEREPEADAGGA